MKKLLLVILCMSAISLGVQPASAKMMNVSRVDVDDHTAKEEAEGREIWKKMQVDELVCDDLAADDFESLGEYFMGLMMGNSHAAMNQMMVQTMGEDGEEAMHEVMGKRMSTCDTAAVLPLTATGFMPMMQMMSGGYNNSMMGTWGFGVMGWGLMILLWILTILAIVALVKWLMTQSHSTKK